MKKIKFTPIIIAAGIVLGTAARVFAISRTDMTTGLLLRDTALLCNILYYGVVILTAAAAVISSHIDGKRGVCGTAEMKPSAKFSAAVGFAALAIALCACYDGLWEAKAYTPMAFMTFIDFVFAAALGIVAFATLYMKQFKPGLGFAYVLGGIYFACRGIYCFMNRMVITTVPEFLIDCMTAICGAMFFAVFARLFSGNGGKVTVKAFFAWGTVTCVMTLSSFLGAAVSKVLLSSEISERIVFTANEAEFYFQALHGDAAYKMAFPPLPNAALGVFAAIAMAAVCFARNTEE